MPRQEIAVADVTVAPGERGFGFLRAGELAAGTEVRIPFQAIHGAADGPTLCFESTLHGWEPMGAEVIRRALLRVEPARLRGTILSLPLANPFAVEFGGNVESSGQRVNPADQLDMNRVWPGKERNAWLTEKMAHVMWSEVVGRCDYLIDIHDGTGACDELPVAFPYPVPTDGAPIQAAAVDGVGEGAAAPRGDRLTPAEMNDRIRGLAQAFGSRVIWWRETPLNPTMISGQALLQGIVALVVEVGGGGIVDETIDQGVDCLLNLLKHLDMIDGEPVLPPRQVMVSDYVVYRSLTGGFYQAEPDIRLGVEVRRGQLLGRVVDPVTSEVKEECLAPVNGIVVSRRLRLPLNPGGYVAHIADTDAVIWQREN